jgi:hypothetical protein
MSTAMAASADPEESPGDVNGRTRPRTVGEMAAASICTSRIHEWRRERSGSDIDPDRYGSFVDPTALRWPRRRRRRVSGWGGGVRVRSGRWWRARARWRRAEGADWPARAADVG